MVFLKLPTRVLAGARTGAPTRRRRGQPGRRPATRPKGSCGPALALQAAPQHKQQNANEQQGQGDLHSIAEPVMFVPRLRKGELWILPFRPQLGFATAIENIAVYRADGQNLRRVVLVDIGSRPQPIADVRELQAAKIRGGLSPRIVRADQYRGVAQFVGHDLEMQGRVAVETVAVPGAQFERPAEIGADVEGVLAGVFVPPNWNGHADVVLEIAPAVEFPPVIARWPTHQQAASKINPNDQTGRSHKLAECSNTFQGKSRASRTGDFFRNFPRHRKTHPTATPTRMIWKKPEN